VDKIPSIKNTKIFSHPLAIRLWLSQIQPLRFLFYLHLASFVIPGFEIHWKSSIFILNYIPILVVANIIFYVFINFDKFRNKSLLDSIPLFAVIFLGFFTVEYIGFLAQTLISFNENPTPTQEDWKLIALLFTGIGGFMLEISNYVSEKLDERIKLTKKQQKIVAVLLLIMTITLIIYSLQVTPLWKILPVLS